MLPFFYFSTKFHWKGQEWGDVGTKPRRNYSLSKLVQESVRIKAIIPSKPGWHHLNGVMIGSYNCLFDQIWQDRLHFARFQTKFVRRGDGLVYMMQLTLRYYNLCSYSDHFQPNLCSGNGRVKSTLTGIINNLVDPF